jgi:hypothetical protein
MPERTSEQKIGDQREQWLLSEITSHPAPSWIARRVEKDFGIDVVVLFSMASRSQGKHCRAEELKRFGVRDDPSHARSDNTLHPDAEFESEGLTRAPNR